LKREATRGFSASASASASASGAGAGSASAWTAAGAGGAVPAGAAAAGAAGGRSRRPGGSGGGGPSGKRSGGGGPGGRVSGGGGPSSSATLESFAAGAAAGPPLEPFGGAIAAGGASAMARSCGGAASGAAASRGSCPANETKVSTLHGCQLKFQLYTDVIPAQRHAQRQRPLLQRRGGRGRDLGAEPAVNDLAGRGVGDVTRPVRVVHRLRRAQSSGRQQRAGARGMRALEASQQELDWSTPHSCFRASERGSREMRRGRMGLSERRSRESGTRGVTIVSERMLSVDGCRQWADVFRERMRSVNGCCQ